MIPTPIDQEKPETIAQIIAAAIQDIELPAPVVNNQVNLPEQPAPVVNNPVNVNVPERKPQKWRITHRRPDGTLAEYILEPL